MYRQPELRASTNSEISSRQNNKKNSRNIRDIYRRNRQLSLSAGRKDSSSSRITSLHTIRTSKPCSQGQLPRVSSTFHWLIKKSWWRDWLTRQPYSG